MITGRDEVVYSELSFRALRNLREHQHKGCYVVADCTRLPFAPGAFSHAVCSEVIEHVPDPRASLVNIYEALAPGGVLVLTTPQKWSTTELVGRLLDLAAVRWLARQIYREPVDALGHISRLTSGEL